MGNHDAAVTQAAELLAGPDPRRGSVMEGGRSGNRRASIAAGNLLRQLQVCWNSRIEFTATAVKVVCLIEMCTLVVCWACRRQRMKRMGWRGWMSQRQAPASTA